MSVTDEFTGKKVCIWGFGREGQSTKHFLARCCKPELVEVFEGKREDLCEENYDIIVKSPGIIMEEDNPKFTSQTELFLKEYRDKIVGITGTKGKSTTSAMLYHVLKASGKKVILLGNIGEPCLDYFEEVDEDTIVVFEMSCHQLAHVDVSPRVAVFLSFFEEHLDYYKTKEKYFAAKENITRFQKPSDYLFIGDDVPPVRTTAKEVRICRDNHGFYELAILGEHNQYNAEFVYRIATGIYGCEAEDVRNAFGSFTGLPHRLQYIGEKDDIRFYDDSISTIPSATIEAVHSIPDVGTVIIGGMDRGINYDSLVRFVRDNSELIFIFTYDSGKRIYSEVEDADNTKYVEDLEKATKLAMQITPKGKACVLSPASASYGYFKNFEQRGEMFKEYAGV